MRNNKRITLIYILLICTLTVSAKTSISELYKELNEALSKREFYIDQKQKTIDGYKAKLKNATTLKERYELSNILINEYAYFHADSAFFYSNYAIDIASELKNENAYFEALLQQAYILSWQGYFHEPIEILQSIDVETLAPNLRSNYYGIYMIVYYFRQLGIMNAQYRLFYRAETLKYTDLYLASQPVSIDRSPLYLTVLGYKYYQLRDYQSAISYLTEAVRKNSDNPSSNVDTQYVMYLSYSAMGEGFEEEAEGCLLQSAILGIKTASLRETSLIEIALLQNEKGNYSLAFNCIDAAISNMELCQNKDFKIRAESARLTIQETYNKQETKELRVLYYCAILALIVSVIVIGVLTYIWNKNKTLQACRKKLLKNNEQLLRNNEQLLRNNNKLSISNALKNSYIIDSLNLSFSYINKLDETRKLMLRKITIKQPADSLKSDIDAMVDAKEERQKLYIDFDKTFYKIYPDFIEKVNLLMQKGHYFLAEDINVENNRTSTELRILALIKMGLTDNKQIAPLLQFTVQSVYNYRNKIRSRAINPDTFEEDFDKI